MDGDCWLPRIRTSLERLSGRRLRRPRFLTLRAEEAARVAGEGQGGPRRRRPPLPPARPLDALLRAHRSCWQGREVAREVTGRGGFGHTRSEEGI